MTNFFEFTITNTHIAGFLFLIFVVITCSLHRDLQKIDNPTEIHAIEAFLFAFPIFLLSAILSLSFPSLGDFYYIYHLVLAESWFMIATLLTCWRFYYLERTTYTSGYPFFVLILVFSQSQFLFNLTGEILLSTVFCLFCLLPFTTEFKQHKILPVGNL